MPWIPRSWIDSETLEKGTELFSCYSINQLHLCIHYECSFFHLVKTLKDKKITKHIWCNSMEPFSIILPVKLSITVLFKRLILLFSRVCIGQQCQIHSCSSFLQQKELRLVFQNKTVKMPSEHAIDTVLCVFKMLHSKDTLENNPAPWYVSA